MSLRLLVGIRFQVLFHSPYRGAFHLSLTVLVLYRSLSSTQPQRVVSLFSDRIPRVPPYSILHILLPITGLSPSSVNFPKLFFYRYMSFLAGPISLATTLGVSVDFLSYRYLDVSVPCVRSSYTMYSCESTTRVVGSPIRISTDQCLFTTPRSFSQCITSFVASDCQGIHQMPLYRLILLRINNLHYLYCSVKSTRLYFYI